MGGDAGVDGKKERSKRCDAMLCNAMRPLCVFRAVGGLGQNRLLLY